jgi:hypothetical protein
VITVKVALNFERSYRLSPEQAKELNTTLEDIRKSWEQSVGSDVKIELLEVLNVPEL